MKCNIQLFLLFFLFAHFALAQQEEAIPVQLDWKQVSTASGTSANTLNGAFIGYSNEAVLIAGGSYYDELLDTILFSNQIEVFTKNEQGNFEAIQNAAYQTPLRVAHGLTLSTKRGMACLGGKNDQRATDNAFLLKWDKALKKVQQEALPKLPVALAHLAGGNIGDILYVAGSDHKKNEKYFWQLDLNALQNGWTALPLWPGPTRSHAVGVVQNNGEVDGLYLFNGQTNLKDRDNNLLTDGLFYQPQLKRWSTIGVRSTMPVSSPPFSATAALATGANHILIFGGVRERRQNELRSIRFINEIWAFHTITESWTKVGQLPLDAQPSTQALASGETFILATATNKGANPSIWQGTASNKQGFGTLNYLVVILYFLILLWLGFKYSKNQNNVNDYFKGGQRIPWWAVGISIFGTQLSAISFMAVPAKTFATDWLYLFLSLTIFMVTPFVVRYFLPFYRKFNLTTAYEYLELRFNVWTRTLGSILYLMLQFGKLGAILLLPSMALSVVSGIDVKFCIVAMGLFSIVYTVLGGIEAVIWTDVIQVLVLLTGAFISLFILWSHLDTQDIITHVSDYQKMRILDTTFSFSSPTLWVVLIGGFSSNLILYGSDQTVVQRYLTSKDEQSAAKGAWTGAWISIPAILLFFFLGTLLFVFYKTQPASLNYMLDNTDAIFPWFIVSNLPDGVSGLLIAAIFAASMSSLDSSMNSVSTVITTDFFRRFKMLSSETAYLRGARVITAVVGFFGTGLALYMADLNITSLWDYFSMIIGLFTGGLGGIFLLGIFTKKGNSTGAVISLLLSAAFQFYIKENTSIHFFMYALTGMAFSFVVGYIISWVTGGSSKEKQAMTIREVQRRSK